LDRELNPIAVSHDIYIPIAHGINFAKLV